MINAHAWHVLLVYQVQVVMWEAYFGCLSVGEEGFVADTYQPC